MPTFASKPGSDLAMTNRNPDTGRFDIDWDTTGDPTFDDTEGHRVLSLVIEHRATASEPGYWAAPASRSYLYTLKSLRASTPSQAEAYVEDALQKAIDDGAIDPDPVVACRRIAGGIDLSVTYTARGETFTQRAVI